MGELARPHAKRLQRPSWRDARLLAGVVLVLLATALGAKVVASADDTEPMYAASRPLKPGDQLTMDNLARVDVNLGERSAKYVSARQALSHDSYALREVREGELVPASAVGGQGEVGVQPVTVQVEASSAAGLAVGSVVDVWLSPRDPATTQERYLDAVLALERVAVSAVPSQQGRFGTAAATAPVQLRVPRSQVPTVIGGVDRKARFTLVPVPGSLTRS